MALPRRLPGVIAVDGFEATELGRIFREESGRAVASLIRVFGDIDRAEDAVQEAFAIAAERWPREGLPPNPGGWITTTARNRAIDRWRRDSKRHDRHAEAARIVVADPPLEEVVGEVPDDQLRLIFTCCHPALSRGAQVALTLRLLGGLQTVEIARAFLVPEPTMAQRLVRAKRKIRAANIPYRVPEDHELPARLGSVLDVLYLVYNEGHTASSGDQLSRPDLSHEAVRLARILAGLMPDEPEVVGLLALMLLSESRRGARTARDGSLIRLADQDRGRWDRALIDEGHELVRACLRRDAPGRYQIQAAINAVHADAATIADTDWGQILALYDQLLRVAPTPIVALNRAVVVAEIEGPATALAILDRLDLDGYHLLHASRAELLARLGRGAEAVDAYGRALGLTTNTQERRFLEERRDALTRG